MPLCLTTTDDELNPAAKATQAKTREEDRNVIPWYRYYQRVSSYYGRPTKYIMVSRPMPHLFHILIFIQKIEDV